LRFALHPVGSVVVFGASWALAADRAGKLVQAWQAWAPRAPDAITSILRLSRRRDGAIALHCAGQSIGPEAQLRRELNALFAVARPSAPAGVRTTSFLGAIDHFAGGWNYEAIYLKGKSDYVATPLGGAGVAALTGALARPGSEGITLICDSYGGAVGRVAADATAFAHRAGMLYSIQYYSAWENPAQTSARLAQMRSFHAALRPHMSGAAYVNYCDLDLADWAASYWGGNLARLRRIKAAFDPQDVFRHAQSVRPE
jgi:FAD/FMN-containing dehydrogenase